MNINITEAKKEDYKDFLEVFNEIEELHRLGASWNFKKPKSKDFFKNYYNKLVEDKNCKFLLAKEGKDIVGYVIADKKEVTKKSSLMKVRKWIWVNDLVVKKTKKRNGIGSLLMEKIEMWAKENKIKEFELNVWTFNTSAIDFYEKRGYEIYSQKMRKVIK